MILWLLSNIGKTLTQVKQETPVRSYGPTGQADFRRPSCHANSPVNQARRAFVIGEPDSKQSTQPEAQAGRYTQIILFLNLRILTICVHLPARAPGRLALLGWRASSHVRRVCVQKLETLSLGLI